MTSIKVKYHPSATTGRKCREVKKYIKPANEQSLSNFMQGVICQLKQLGKIRTSETYTSTLASFMKFRAGQDIILCDIDGNMMMQYEAWLKGKGICPNTTSFYMRILRAVYNRAVENELTEQRYPFKHVYTGIDKTVKRAMPLKAIRQIKGLDLANNHKLDYARDMFLFSFYTRGMSFVDMAYLRKSDLKNGIITYRRRKTGQLLTVKWEKCMEDIIAKYHGNHATRYLLPIITNPMADERTQYHNAIRIDASGEVDFSKMAMLSDTAVNIISALQKEPLTAEEIAKRLAVEYDVTEEEAKADVEELLTEMESQGLVTIEGHNTEV